MDTFLSDFISATDFCLIIQYDGFVLFPDKWDANFFNFDYIGAPWPIPDDNFSFRDINNVIQRVGNGGFTFRSKKLLQLASKLNLNWQLYHGFCHEDGYISVNNRHIYEKNECKFAPLEVAKYFSHEIDIPENKNIIPFGFHGKHTMYYKYFIENEYFINLN